MKKYILKVVYRDIDPIVKDIDILSKKEAIQLVTNIFLSRPCISVFLFDENLHLIFHL